MSELREGGGAPEEMAPKMDREKALTVLKEENADILRRAGADRFTIDGRVGDDGYGVYAEQFVGSTVTDGEDTENTYGHVVHTYTVTGEVECDPSKMVEALKNHRPFLDATGRKIILAIEAHTGYEQDLVPQTMILEFDYDAETGAFTNTETDYAIRFHS